MTTQKSYYRIRLGEKHEYAKECYEGKFIGVHDKGIFGDLTDYLCEDRDIFIEKFRSKFLKHNPTKKKGAVTRAIGTNWNVCKGIKKGDIVLCPNGNDECWIGKVISDYLYQGDNDFFPHQRKVAWLKPIVAYADMSSGLKKTAKHIRQTDFNITNYADEIEEFISKANPSLQK